MNRAKNCLLIIIVITCYFCKNAMAFDNKITHPDITDKAVSSSRLDQYLKNNLGFSVGLGTYFPSTDNEKTILYWLTKGSTEEDIPNCRADNHFHDPIKNMGLSDVLYNAPDTCGIFSPGPILFPCSPSAINVGIGFLAWCTADGIRTGRSYIPWYSTVTWATGYTSAGNPAKITTTKQDTGNEWDWDHARSYYYDALREKDTAKRSENFANTFKGIGNILHLLQDMAVPAHVRNDFVGHVWPEWFEKYVKDNADNLGLIKKTTAIEITNASYTNFWDSDLYDGTNPSITTLLPGLTEGNQLAGLAEYTNANFLSKNTLLTEDYNQYGPYYFPYPRATSTVRWKDTSNNKNYLRKNGDGETVEHLAVTGLLYGYRFKYFPQTKLWWPIMLDDKCHYDYAQKLLPKAVGYSAGLLNYFFRGTIEITPPAQYVYSIADGSQTPYTDAYGNKHQQFTKIKANIKNTTPNEAMTAGTITAVAKYKKRTDYQSDLSGDPPYVASQNPLRNASMDSNFSYSVSATRELLPEELASMNVNPTEFTFDFSSDPIPAGVTDLSLQVVFKGTLGNEKDNAIAVGYKDLMEPTHQVFWNLTDRFSIAGPSDTVNHLRTGADIRADQELLAVVAAPPSVLPYIDPYDLKYEISYMGSPSTAASAVPSARVTLPAGNYIRLVLLVEKRSDTDDLNSSRVHYLKLAVTDTIDNSTDNYTMQFLGALNQLTPTVQNDIFYYTDVEPFRTILSHLYTGILRCRPAGTYTTGEVYCRYEEAEAPPLPNPWPYDQVKILY